MRTKRQSSRTESLLLVESMADQIDELKQDLEEARVRLVEAKAEGLRDAILCHIERIKHKDGIARDTIAHNGWEHADGDSCNVCEALSKEKRHDR